MEHPTTLPPTDALTLAVAAIADAARRSLAGVHGVDGEVRWYADTPKDGSSPHWRAHVDYHGTSVAWVR